MMEIASSHCENSTKSEVFPFTAALPFQWIVPTGQGPTVASVGGDWPPGPGSTDLQSLAPSSL